jgi:hypothetical protein
MTTTIVRGGAVSTGEFSRTQALSTLEKFIVRSSHPVSLYFQVIGSIWFVFFFWNHLWIEALLTYLVARFLGALAVSRTDVGVLGQTMLARLALLHLHGSNLLIQSAGLLVALYGLWMHETRVILTGLSLILLGHVQGWDRVDPRLKAS